MQDRDRVVAIAEQLGFAPVPSNWRDVDAVLPILERMRAEGAVVLFKLDGQRTDPGDNGPYTAVVSGKPLGEEGFYRIDAQSLEDALAYIIVQYARHRWGYDQ